MPTPVAHSLAGITIALLKSGKRPVDSKFFAASVVAASFADVDFGIGFLIGRNVHHYFTHSIGFTLLFAGAAYLTRASLCPRPTRVRRPRPRSGLPLAHPARPAFEGHRGPLRIAALLAALGRVLHFPDSRVRRHLAGYAGEALRAPQLARRRLARSSSWARRRALVRLVEASAP